jgi:pyruvate,water dikinase
MAGHRFAVRNTGLRVHNGEGVAGGEAGVIRWLAQIGAADAPSVGGKAASLGELAQLGLRVPPGFALEISAYRQFLAAAGLGAQIAADLAGLDPSDVEDVARRCALVRDLVGHAPMEAAVSAAIRAAYQQLCDSAGAPAVPVAVRSSALDEDSVGASFAGEHDTYLWVTGEDDVLLAVRNCWASLFTDRATAYREEMDREHATAAMGVIVQAMVRPRSAGVAFTLDPANGDRSAVAIESSWGFGEVVVSGEVTPDSFLVNKVLLTITRSTVSRKSHEYRLDDSRLVLAPIDEDRASTASLSDDEVIEIARLGRLVEKHFGCPQDLEWAIEADVNSDAALTLLQARPETVWSRREVDRGDVEVPGDYLSGIVTTLMAPLHSRTEAGQPDWLDSST